MKKIYSIFLISAIFISLLNITSCGSFFPWTRVDQVNNSSLKRHPLYRELLKTSTFKDYRGRRSKKKRSLVAKLVSGNLTFIADKPVGRYGGFIFYKKKPKGKAIDEESNIDHFSALALKFYRNGNKRSVNYHKFGISIYKNGNYSGNIAVDYGKEEKALKNAGIKPTYFNMEHVHLYWLHRDKNKYFKVDIDRRNGLMALYFRGDIVFSKTDYLGRYERTETRKFNTEIYMLGYFDKRQMASLPVLKP